jgi:hypothetical protein
LNIKTESKQEQNWILNKKKTGICLYIIVKNKEYLYLSVYQLNLEIILKKSKVFIFKNATRLD